MMKHIIITPIYNEEAFLSTFLESIVNQSLLPYELILVDDNSSDNSRKIIEKYTLKYSWIKYIYHSSADGKSQGKKVINAFNYGLKFVSIDEVDFLSKIDADLSFPSGYFEEVANSFANNEKLGITGGVIEELQDGVWTKIPQASYHIRGALKSYRKTCFEQMEGLMPVLGWDGLDEMKALYYGWKTQIINIGIKHFRPASKDYDRVKLSRDLGVANYKNGASPFLAIVRSVVKIKQKPYFRVGIAFIQGYLYAYKSRCSKNVDANLARFINKFHMQRLKKLKRF